MYVGFNVLDLNKLFMYEFHYNYVRRHYNAKLVFAGAGSLVYVHF